MTRGVRVVATVILVALPTTSQVGTAQGGQWQPPRIVILKPSSRGVINEGQTFGLVERFTHELRRRYPCARILNQDEIAVFIKVDRERQLLGTGDDGAMDRLGRAIDADLVVSLSFYTTGTTHSTPQRHAQMSMLDPKNARTAERAEATGDGWDWNPGSIMPELIAALKGRELCPWLGRVEFMRQVRKDSSWRAPPVPNGAGTQTERYSSTEQRDDAWTFTLDRRGIGEPRLTTKGASSYASTEDLIVELKGVNCFPEVNGEVRDDRMITGAASLVSTHSEGRGHGSEPLQEARMSVTEGPVVNGLPTFELSFGGLASLTPGGGQAYEEKKGDCGNWKRLQEVAGPLAGFALSVGHMISAVVNNLRPENNGGTLKGVRMYRDEDGALVRITWDLRRY